VIGGWPIEDLLLFGGAMVCAVLLFVVAVRGR
jgi:hypothetical protein